MANWYDVVERTRRHEEQYNEQEPCDDLLVMLLDGRGHPCHDASLDDMQVITVGPHMVPGQRSASASVAEDERVDWVRQPRYNVWPEQRANSAPGETPTALNVDALQRHAYVSA
jgi:hypothetical protein